MISSPSNYLEISLNFGTLVEADENPSPFLDALIKCKALGSLRIIQDFRAGHRFKTHGKETAIFKELRATEEISTRILRALQHHVSLSRLAVHCTATMQCSERQHLFQAFDNRNKSLQSSPLVHELKTLISNNKVLKTLTVGLIETDDSNGRLIPKEMNCVTALASTLTDPFIQNQYSINELNLIVGPPADNSSAI